MQGTAADQAAARQNSAMLYAPTGSAAEPEYVVQGTAADQAAARQNSAMLYAPGGGGNSSNSSQAAPALGALRLEVSDFEAGAGGSGAGGLSAAVRSGRSAGSIKRVQSRAAALSRTTFVEGACTVILPGKKAGAKMWLIGSTSTDAASGKLEIYEKKAAGAKGMPKMTIRGKNIISATMATVKGKEAVVMIDGRNQDPEKAKKSAYFAADADGGQLLADLLAFASRGISSIGIAEGGFNEESSL